MLDNVLQQITSQLDRHLRHCFQLSDDGAVLSNLLELDGTSVPSTLNTLVLFLVGIERNANAHQVQDEEAHQHTRGSNVRLVNMNLLVMCAANFSGKNYPEGLKFLSCAIQFFQERPVLNHENTPSLPPQLDKLILSIEALSVSEMNKLWSVHTGRYLPSVLYRVQMVSTSS